MPTTILILTRGYARYRENLFSGVAAALPSSYRVIHSTPHFGDDLWEVDWDSLLEDGGVITHIKFPKITILAFIRALLGRITINKEHSPELRRPVTIEDVSPDMVLIQEYSFPMLKVLLYCFLRGIPCIVCSDLGRDSDWQQFPWISRIIHRNAAFMTSAVIAHTCAAKTPLSAPERPICFIPHSVDISSFAYSPDLHREGPVRILMVAQYIPRKGHDLLANAVRLLLDRGLDDFQIRLVGTQDPTWLESIIHKKKLGTCMHLTGMLKGEALFDEFNLADVFVLTSRFDTFAVAVHEAAAFGLPLLVSKYAEASALLVSEGINGHVIDPYDAVALADFMEELIAQSELRQSMGKQSRIIGESLCASKLGAELADWLVEFHQKITSSPPTYEA